MRSLVVLLVAACDPPIERLSLSSQCGFGEIDVVEATIDGVALCGRGRFTRDVIDVGEQIAVVAPLTAGDGTVYRLVIGMGPERERRWIDPSPPRRSDKSGIYTGAFAELIVTPPLELNAPGEHHDKLWFNAKGGFVDFEHYDPQTGHSRGSFEVVFEAYSSRLQTKRLVRAKGTMATSGPASGPVE